SLMARIDTDMESLILLDGSATGDPALDPVLSRIASEADQRNAQYWVERLAPQAESIIDMTLDRLCRLRILQHHDGDFWSLAGSAWRMGVHAGSEVGTAVEHVKTRISRAIFDNEIPDPRDVIIVCLIDTCDVLRFIFELDEEAEQRVQDISRMDLIGRAIADAVGQNIAGAQFRRSALAKKIAVVPLRRVLRSRHVRTGNLPALFADLHGEFGPVFEIRPPLAQDMICLVGPEANHWVHRHGRMHLRARDYLEDFEKVYGGVGLLPALDGADHFRYRKSIQPAYSRARLEERLDELLSYARTEMSDWNVGGTRPAVGMCRKLVNSAMSPLTVGIDSQDVVDDMHKFKDRALKTHIGRTLPKFMLKTPPMRRRAKLVGAVVDRVLSGHTPAQRIGCPRDLADDLLTMHNNDRQFLPESNLRFVLSAPLIASMYVGDQLSFIVYAMVSQPEFHDRIRAEADAVFAGGDPDRETLTGPATDVTRRFIMECMRLYPIVPLSVRNVMNACEVEGYELPEGRRVFIVQTATHYMDSLFADPSKFDIDRYEAPRKEHVGTAYAPYGLGTHNCLGARLTELYLATNLLLVAHHFELEIAPKNYKLKISPFPSMSPSKKLKFRIAEQRHELPA
ncbi:MAG: cytochrome P450, partial [Acidimicrobiaceae bacterium]|nr:cytochrome P450 [Acidimicrobiaceae bacterium]